MTAISEFDDAEEFTELYDAQISRIDLVGKGASGLPFLIAKGADTGLLSADEVRSLIAKAKKPRAVFDAHGRLVGTVDPNKITAASDGTTDEDSTRSQRPATPGGQGVHPEQDKVKMSGRSGDTLAPQSPSEAGTAKAVAKAKAIVAGTGGPVHAADQAAIADALGAAAASVLKAQLAARGRP